MSNCVVCGKKEYQRSIELAEQNTHYGNFYDAIQTEASIRSYTYGMRNFMVYLVAQKYITTNEDFSTVVGFGPEKSTDLLKLFIKYLKKRGLKPLSVNAYVAPLFLFFDMNRVALFKKEINKVRDKNDVEQSGHTPVTTVEIQDMLQVITHPRERALISFLSSTGMRPGGLNDPILRMKHLEYMADPNNPSNTKYCYAVKVYDGSRQYYWGFLTPESTKALEKYFTWRKITRNEEFTEDTVVFTNIFNTSGTNDIVRSSLYRILTKIYTKSGLVRTKQGFRYDKAITYMYRIRFNTILKLTNNLNSNIAEKLMAHKKGLDGSYLQPTREECFTEFVKAIPLLTISDEERTKAKLVIANQKNIELEVKNNEIDELKEMITEMRDNHSVEPNTQIRDEVLKILKEKHIDFKG